ncbi:ski2-like helicase [Pseudomonas aeruginosa]|uniref:DEAD/DEAH box helicase n=1 Tax=Pseudomonas aeruginosa TaxID=287 RepID=UPI000774F46C|nr:DEAD/DEAH box helicase [Pseudomonas aeruginosa]KXG14941.1 ski2-like helicase [Pseudomonas aeruginosa]RTR54484.1 DEAD/DEAH box helicase [Pseudomonas aeruginosa]RTR63985.1 DEAD/DEAH box helicase [Pseudomonas aeruginosa]
MKELTIRKLANTGFKDLYFQLLRKEEMKDSDVVKLLAIAVLLLNHQALEIKRLGYRIILFYGNVTGRYEALYDVALNNGLHPVSAVISNHFPENDNRNNSFMRNIVESYVDTFRDQGIVLTEQQEALRTFVQSEYGNSSVVVAPTSYGKSELIIQSVRENPRKKILILVPSKALMAQTKKRLIYADIDKLGKVITHPEMFDPDRNDRSFVLTQERLNRLLNDHPSLSFDMVFVDEAHNLLQNERRSELLATMLCILGARKKKTSFKFLTPFLCNELNVRVRYLDMIPKGFKIDEYIKSERFYLRDFRPGKGDGKLKLYDHFLNDWIDLSRKYQSCFELIRGESLKKNIIYGNKKKGIEAFAVQLADTLPTVDCPLINQACEELKLCFDRRYRLIRCLKKGVMYHHGSIPDTIRLYLEALFSNSKKMKYLVCNSTLLEGVNLPIERLFVFDYTKGRSNLTSSQFKNLIGRVNRFSEVFSPDSKSALKMLESSIYLLGVDGFTSKRANIQSFYTNTVHVTQVDQDSVGNVLLEATTIVDGKVSELYEDAIQRLENLHHGLVKEKPCQYVETEIGKLMIANSISEIDVFDKEHDIDHRIRKSIEANGQINDINRLMKAILKLFIENFDESREYSDLLRLKQPAALSFYSMLLDWKLQQYSIKRMIRLTLRYWHKLVNGNLTDYVFVGKWGDSTFGNSKYEHWVKISEKNLDERVNLAIVRLKDEEDFFENKIFKFIEVLNGVGALNSNFYKRIKYGTTDDLKIRLIRDGFSRGLADLILGVYSKMISVSADGEIQIDPRVVRRMERDNVSDLLIFEARLSIKVL